MLLRSEAATLVRQFHAKCGPDQHPAGEDRLPLRCGDERVCGRAPEATAESVALDITLPKLLTVADCTHASIRVAGSKRSKRLPWGSTRERQRCHAPERHPAATIGPMLVVMRPVGGPRSPRWFTDFGLKRPGW